MAEQEGGRAVSIKVLVEVALGSRLESWPPTLLNAILLIFQGLEALRNCVQEDCCSRYKMLEE